MNRSLRVYADTSVFGGASDPEFAVPTLAFFDHVRAGALELVVSALVVDELEAAPAQV